MTSGNSKGRAKEPPLRDCDGSHQPCHQNLNEFGTKYDDSCPLQCQSIETFRRRHLCVNPLWFRLRTSSSKTHHAAHWKTINRDTQWYEKGMTHSYQREDFLVSESVCRSTSLQSAPTHRPMSPLPSRTVHNASPTACTDPNFLSVRLTTVGREN